MTFRGSSVVVRTIGAAAGLALVCGTCQAQAVWMAKISDAYQHQRWGNDRRGDATWESNGGWCMNASKTNQLYYWRQKGKPVFGSFNGAAVNPGDAKELSDQIKKFKTSLDAQWQNGEKLVKGLNDVLESRGVGKSSRDARNQPDGLLVQMFKQVGAAVKYISSTGDESNLGKGTLFSHLAAIFTAKDAVDLRLSYEKTAQQRRGTPQAGLWWAGREPEKDNFHNVTVAGYNTAGKGTIYFADPDSNPMPRSNDGNRDQDAGWDSSPANWRAAPNAVDVKQRRFREGPRVIDPTPVPGGAAPNANEQKRLYYAGTLNENGTHFEIANADFDRYNGVFVRYLQTMEAFRGGNKNAPNPLPDTGGSFVFSVSPGLPDARNIINEFWLFAASSQEMITSVDVLSQSGWNVELLGTNYVDPWDNQRRFGGVHIWTDADANDGLLGDEYLDFSYQTAGLTQLTAWDLVYNDRFDTSLASLSVQAVGGLAGYDVGGYQVPTPAAMGLLGGAVAFRSRRRR
ncbi:MAG: hypothetical protein KJZ65_05375 [Phycisphaerales bacterium]|nr:hypothetical protein [Phycisphaerales bacterium]